MFLLDDQQKFVLVWAIAISIFALLILIATIFLIRRLVKMRKLGKESTKEIDESGKEEFLLAFGGNDNIVEVKREMSRITVKVKDVDSVDTTKLKELGANGILLVGDMVKCSFNELAQNVYKVLER